MQVKAHGDNILLSMGTNASMKMGSVMDNGPPPDTVQFGPGSGSAISFNPDRERKSPLSSDHLALDHNSAGSESIPLSPRLSTKAGAHAADAHECRPDKLRRLRQRVNSTIIGITVITMMICAAIVSEWYNATSLVVEDAYGATSLAFDCFDAHCSVGVR